MEAWHLAVNLKDVVLDFSILSLLLIIGSALRRYVPFFRRFLIPNNIIAGFIGLILGAQLLGLFDLNSDRLGKYVYHLLALTFITIGLRQSKGRWGKGPINKSFIELTCYIIQAVIGLLIGFVFIYTIKPDLFAGMGFLLPLGFGMGPGIAYTMGQSWEKFGFANGGMVGLTFSVIGFLIAYFVGIIIVNRGISQRKTEIVDGPEDITEDVRMGVIKNGKPQVAGYLTLSQEAIEPLAFQAGLIGSVYFMTYGLLFLITSLMAKAGLSDFVDTIWSFHFIFGLLIAVLVRKIMDVTDRSYLIDRGLMSRLSGLSVDYLIVASIAAINFTLIKTNLVPVLIMSLLAGFATYFIIKFTAYRSFNKYNFERFIGIFGEMTGTINSGLVLIRVTDPNFDSPAAEDLAYGGGIALFMGLPLLIMLNLPMTLFDNTLSGYWITLGMILAYLLILWLVWWAVGLFHFNE
ncbi:MAG TPA: hypothetical protein VKP78_05330 [bacterium]|nr:hypothetical protein [bacterium]